MLSPTPSSQLCPCAMATLDSCSNCARGLTFPLSPVQTKQKGFEWDQQHARMWKVMTSEKKVDIPPAFHIYFTLGMIVVTILQNRFIKNDVLGMLGFICFWSFILLRIYLPETYWSWSNTSNIRQWVSGAWRNWKLYGRFEGSVNNATLSIFSKFKKN